MKENNNIFHVLNGDALKTQLPAISGRIIVARECLVDGNVSGTTLEVFWKNRAAFLEVEEKAYFQKVVLQFEELMEVSEGSEVNLWFEYDLFCQVNLWFCCWLLDGKTNVNTFWVAPFKEAGWKGFGGMNSQELQAAYNEKQSLTDKDIQFFSNCWLAYQHHDLAELSRIANASRFSFLPEVVQAHIERFVDNGRGRPERALLNIISGKKTREFGSVFREFCEREGIYGFGDRQVKRLMEKINN